MFNEFNFDLIYHEQSTETPLVVMMCGVAGSGKTTFSQRLEKKGFVRLSIDEEIWSTNGRWGIDFPMDKFEEYRKDAESKLRKRLIQLIHDKQQVVIDFSFWDRLRRNEYKKLIKESGGKWKLVYLKVHPDELRKRLKLRNQRFDANSFPISDELLNSYVNGFEVPSDEGEIVVVN
ncbi:ATP-binding protein [Fictibacillus sp. 7GRE50]|uniref:AAA family ATPase n=1 Tax=unclassified Fictibacillus TaxID=2644029 RepID=UPI0018CE80A5|nr:MULTISPECIES: ATP-binding protein [unclassified Fictibacillus]MBH0166685.1 ATP-binding protein [Fictibacillus sp. 7GRE50]MBH0174306.1 ATP-binding protein [Fictibacillus sp. 23RED33]